MSLLFCVYPVVHWDNIIKSCQKQEVWKKIKKGVWAHRSGVQTFYTLFINQIWIKYIYTQEMKMKENINHQLTNAKL